MARITYWAIERPVPAAMDAREGLALSLLTLYPVALDLPAGFFTDAFREPQFSFRL
jgi:hypothetical protein